MKYSLREYEILPLRGRMKCTAAAVHEIPLLRNGVKIHSRRRLCNLD